MTDSQTVTLHGDPGNLLQALRRRGWNVDNDPTGRPVDLAVVLAEELMEETEEWPGAAMTSAAETIALISQLGGRLSAGGLALIVVKDPPERACSARAGNGVLSATLAAAVRLFASDWACTSGARCLLAVLPVIDVDDIDALARWLTRVDAPPLTGHVIDVAAARHIALRPAQ
jgi:hypothetical protein